MALNHASKAKKVTSTAWNVLKAVGLNTADGIIALSLMRQGTRPKPGVRTVWPKGLRERLHGEQRGFCMYCRVKLSSSHIDVIAPSSPSHIDHKTPVNQGGTNNPENLQLLCPGCNIRKSDRTDAEFRHRYRTLLPQERGSMPNRRIKQAEFRAATRTARDADSYTRFKAGRYLTATQKVNSGAMATFVATSLAIFLPIQQFTQTDDASILLITSLLTGAAAGAGVRLRARHTGKDQED